MASIKSGKPLEELGQLIAKRPAKNEYKEVEVIANFLEVTKFQYPKVKSYTVDVITDGRAKASRKDFIAAINQLLKDTRFDPAAYDGQLLYSVTVEPPDGADRAKYQTVGRRSILPQPTRLQDRVYLYGGVELIHRFYSSFHPGWVKLLINIKTRDELRSGLTNQEITAIARLDNGEQMTVSQYYKDSGSPLEFPGQWYSNSRLSKDQNRDMNEKNPVKPKDRFARIENAINNIYNHQEGQNLQAIGMGISNKFIKLKCNKSVIKLFEII
ncbi:hypothetical protein Glove_87g147 [Diversispora epigaea]|uniref:Uncharacterized protein n=1 Tax=Diversispora epigaea TaxID=1348612 RepID=A0A397JCX0_9GLOM|nr:hypothetical protein Glove_87g147 [Diversispora epigaea]